MTGPGRPDRGREMNERRIYQTPSRARVEVAQMRSYYYTMVQLYAAATALGLLALALWRLQ